MESSSLRTAVRSTASRPSSICRHGSGQRSGSVLIKDQWVESRSGPGLGLGLRTGQHLPFRRAQLPSKARQDGGIRSGAARALACAAGTLACAAASTAAAASAAAVTSAAACAASAPTSATGHGQALRGRHRRCGPSRRSAARCLLTAPTEDSRTQASRRRRG